MNASCTPRRSIVVLAPTIWPSGSTARRRSSSATLAAGAKSSRIVTSFSDAIAFMTSLRCASARTWRLASANMLSSRARARRASPSSFSAICISESPLNASPCSARPRLSRIAVKTPIAPKVSVPVTRTTAASRAPIEKLARLRAEFLRTAVSARPSAARSSAFPEGGAASPAAAAGRDGSAKLTCVPSIKRER